jgi:hypothetical protein
MVEKDRIGDWVETIAIEGRTSEGERQDHKDWSYKATYALHAYVRICGRFALKKCNRDRLQLPPPSNMAGPSLESRNNSSSNNPGN